jgi:hypothetical protein
LDADDEQQEASNEEVEAGPSSQHHPLEISSDSEIDSEPRRSGRVKKATRVIESQQWQIDYGLIPTPGARGRVWALNAKRKRNIEISHLEEEFELIE